MSSTSGYYDGILDSLRRSHAATAYNAMGDMFGAARRGIGLAFDPRFFQHLGHKAGYPRSPEQPVTGIGSAVQPTAAPATQEAGSPGVPTEPAGPPLPRNVTQTSLHGAFVNNTPPAGYGRAIYSDSAQGAAGFNTRGNFAQALDTNGQPAFGPFGRSQDAQQRIQGRVARYEQAIRLMQGAGSPTERDRLQSRARQRISLDQGIGGFLNQASDRNYARQELRDLDRNATTERALQAGIAQTDFRNQLDIANLQANRYQFATSRDVDPDTGMPVEKPFRFDRFTGISEPIAGVDAGPASAIPRDVMPNLRESDIQATMKAHGWSREQFDAWFNGRWDGKTAWRD